MTETMNQNIKSQSGLKDKKTIQLICASHNVEILKNNLLRSELCANQMPIVQTGYKNISQAYNEAEKTPADVYVYVHHDVFLPPSFEFSLLKSLEMLKYENWGVLGVAGVKFQNNRKMLVGHILDRGKDWGTPFKKAKEVETLDELMLITKGDLNFDENLDLHFYGADICMQAAAQGRKNYVIPAFVEHNSGYNGIRTDDYHKCKQYFARKWKDHLPIVTTTTTITA